MHYMSYLYRVITLGLNDLLMIKRLIGTADACRDLIYHNFKCAALAS